MATRDEIFEKVSETLQEALGSDEDEVTPEAKLMGDLDAESIDLLDIVFQLEKQFGIKIPRAELFPGPADFGEEGSEDELMQDGQLTATGVSELQKRLGHANAAALEEFSSNPKVEHIQDLYTVEMIVNYVEGKLAS